MLFCLNNALYSAVSLFLKDYVMILWYSTQNVNEFNFYNIFRFLFKQHCIQKVNTTIIFT